MGLHTAAVMTAAVRLDERCGFERVPELDLTATDVLGVDDPDVSQVIAYRLDLTHAGRPIRHRRAVTTAGWWLVAAGESGREPTDTPSARADAAVSGRRHRLSTRALPTISLSSVVDPPSVWR